jgi:glycerophosphoryl diester phosphodiesterase
MPPNVAFPFLDWPGPLPFAHAGGALEAPANTMPAFEHAVRLGYRYLETDVHVTSDGVVVAFHDDDLDRTTDGHGLVGDQPWSRVSTVRVDGAEPIPRLDELLAAFPEARINIDPKHDEVVEPLAEVLRRSAAIDRVCVGAFSDRRISRLQGLLGPALCVSMGPKQVARLVAASRGLPGGGGVVAPCAQVPTDARRIPIVTSRFVAEAHRRGVQVHVWTIDDRSEMERLLDLGVDGIMTDRPQVLKDLLEARGQWFE